jgi:hypothetical protein
MRRGNGGQGEQEGQVRACLGVFSFFDDPGACLDFGDATQELAWVDYEVFGVGTHTQASFHFHQTSAQSSATVAVTQDDEEIECLRRVVRYIVVACLLGVCSAHSHVSPAPFPPAMLAGRNCLQTRSTVSRQHGGDQHSGCEA